MVARDPELDQAAASSSTEARTLGEVVLASHERALVRRSRARTLDPERAQALVRASASITLSALETMFLNALSVRAQVDHAIEARDAFARSLGIPSR